MSIYVVYWYENSNPYWVEVEAETMEEAVRAAIPKIDEPVEVRVYAAAAVVDLEIKLDWRVVDEKEV